MLGYYIEHSILGTWSLVLLALFAQQIHRDKEAQWIIQASQQVNVMAFKKFRAVGRTTQVLHLGGIAGAILLSLRSVDPFPVWGFVPDEVIDFLSHATTAVLFICIYEAIVSMIKKLFRIIGWLNRPCIVSCIRVIHVLTVLVAIGTNLTFILYTDQKLYSDGVYFIYAIIVQWIIFIMYARIVGFIKDQIDAQNALIHSSDYNKAKELIRKLMFIQYAMIILLLPVSAYQGYTTYTSYIDDTRIKPVDKNNYKFGSALFMYIHCICFSLILYISYISKDHVADVTGMSEISTPAQSVAMTEHQITVHTQRQPQFVEPPADLSAANIHIPRTDNIESSLTYTPPSSVAPPPPNSTPPLSPKGITFTNISPSHIRVMNSPNTTNGYVSSPEKTPKSKLSSGSYQSGVSTGSYYSMTPPEMYVFNNPPSPVQSLSPPSEPPTPEPSISPPPPPPSPTLSVTYPEESVSLPSVLSAYEEMPMDPVACDRQLFAQGYYPSRVLPSPPHTLRPPRIERENSNFTITVARSPNGTMKVSVLEKEK